MIRYSSTTRYVEASAEQRQTSHSLAAQTGIGTPNVRLIIQPATVSKPTPPMSRRVRGSQEEQNRARQRDREGSGTDPGERDPLLQVAQETQAALPHLVEELVVEAVGLLGPLLAVAVHEGRPGRRRRRR